MKLQKSIGAALVVFVLSKTRKSIRNKFNLIVTE